MQITFRATVNGDDVSAVLPVRLKRGLHRLIASDDGIALTSVPGISLLSATVVVRDNLGIDSEWSAEADEPWLQVTASGRAGDELVLTADPTGLSANTLHYARVELSTNDASVEHADVIRVGLWIGSDAPAVESRIMHRFTTLVADPIRPYVYVHDGGTAISIYHVYTAQLVGTVPDVAIALGSMAISTDGSRLFAYDRMEHEVVPIDLDLLLPGPPFSIDADASVFLAYGRLNGAKLLFSGNGRVHDVETAAELELRFDAGYYGNNIVAVSQDGSHLCALDSGLSPYSINCYAFEYDEVAARLDIVGGGSNSGHFTPRVGSNGQDIALNADGTRAYVASGAPYLFYELHEAAARAGTCVGELTARQLEARLERRVVLGGERRERDARCGHERYR